MTKHLPEPATPDRPMFPTRTPPGSEQTLTGMVIAWSRDVEQYRPRHLPDRVATYQHALWVGSKELDVRSAAWRRFGCHVIGEFVADVDGEPLGGSDVKAQMRASKMLSRMVATYGPTNVLRWVAEALAHGAGLGEGYEDDPLACLKYALAVGKGERGLR